MEMGDWDEAYRAMEESTRRIPNQYASHYFLGLIDILRGEGEKAIEKAHKIESLDPDARTSIGKATSSLIGYSYAFGGRYREALKELEKTVEQYAMAGVTNWEIIYRLQLGEMRTVAGDYEGAFQAFSDMKRVAETVYHPEFNPVLIMSEYWVGWAQLQKGDLSGAKSGADKIASLVKEEQYDSFFLDFYHLLSAELDLSRGDFDSAEDALQKVSHNTSKYSPHFRALQARLQGASGDHSAAIRTYTNMCNEVMRSNWSYGGDTLLFFLNCSKVNYNLGKTYESMGDGPRAIEYYEKALDQWKNADEDLPELIDTKRRLTNLRASS